MQFGDYISIFIDFELPTVVLGAAGGIGQVRPSSHDIVALGISSRVLVEGNYAYVIV